MNPELWDDLLDRTKSRECSFQSFQKNLIKGITSVAQPASEVVDAKKRKVDSIPLNDVVVWGVGDFGPGQIASETPISRAPGTHCIRPRSP